MPKAACIKRYGLQKMSFFAKLNMTFFGENAFIEKKLLRSDAFSMAIIFTRAAFMIYTVLTFMTQDCDQSK